MLKSIVAVVVWLFVAWYAIKIIVGFIYSIQNKYPRQIIRKYRDDIFTIILDSSLLICLLLYNLGVV